jgi:hypothetical protein
MSLIRTFTLVCAAALALTATTARAQGLPNQDTYFTFSQAVELPGKTLPAGTYLFVLADTSDRHIVRVMSKDRKQLQTTLLTIPSYSLDRPSDKPQVRFMETAAGGPQAIKSWFYPGRTVGHEFIYPHEQALRLARRTHEAVLTTKTAEVTDSTKSEDIVRIDETGKEVAMDDKNAKHDTEESIAGSNDAAQDRTPTTAAGPTPRAERSARKALPKTASDLPAIGLFGLAALMMAFSLRRVRLARG